ncbi:hypothetical protein SAMN05216518_1012 [Bacteroidales bacterium KHT7]|nr:hypothetical protein SAMN05216518_1012 [Bacteroidales bacterium KHT7]
MLNVLIAYKIIFLIIHSICTKRCIRTAYRITRVVCFKA